MMTEANDFAAAVTRMAQRIDAQAQGIADLEKLSGGASQDIWAFTLLGAQGPRPLILRRAPLTNAGRAQHAAAGMALEAQTVVRVAQSSVPFPEVAYVLQPEDALGEGYVMARVAGETLPTRIIRQPQYAPLRADFARQCGHILAAIHQVDMAGIALPHQDAAFQIAYYEQAYRETGRARPVFEMALRWLKDHMPAPVPPVLVHGDFRHGNLMCSPQEIVAVLDWEMVHLGDPMEDLGWLCTGPWRFGQIDLPVGGLGVREDLYAAYANASGHAVDTARVHFWEVMGALRWGVLCAGMTEWVRNGAEDTPERCAIARRASENEIDLLNLLLPRKAA